MADVKVKKISTLIGRMIPPHIVELYPTYVRFIQAYFEYTERQFGEYDMIANILGYGDIDNASQVPAYFAEYKKQYMQVMPGNMAIDSVLMIKHIREFYRAKGTEESFRMLFRAIYDKEIDFYYPSVDILRVSDGKWTEPTYLIPVEQDEAILSLWIGQQYSNASGSAHGIIEDIYHIDNPLVVGTKQLAFLVSSNEGVFSLGDAIISQGVVLQDLVTLRYEKQGGYWKGDDGKLSSIKKIQDSFYYQDFSYEILTELSIVQYQELIKRVIHPAGMAMFGKFTTLDGATLDVSGTLFGIWLLMSLNHTSTRPPLIHDTAHNKVGYGTVVNLDFWTLGYIDGNRENNIITNRFPGVGELDYLLITAFTDLTKPSNIWPSTDITII